MWQRIQTLYLAVSAGLLCFLLFGNALTLNTPDGLEAVRYTALAKPYMAIILWILAAIQLVALISFKVRILQMRLSVVAALVSLGIFIWLGVMYFTAPEGAVFRLTAILPLAITVFDFLAARGAFQDQLVVESASRLRSSRRR
ncbi:MAG: DUF4293 family protein [Bacteroidales bacterium]|nr:DUF4293 family protein [Bacteroidales bacterium]